MQVYGADLRDWLATDRWHALWELVTQLPAASRFRAAMVNDPEMARVVVEFEGTDGEPTEPWAPPFEEFDTTNRLLSETLTALRSLESTTIGIAVGGKPPPVKPAPFPRTEIDRERERKDIQDAIAIACKFGFSPEDFV